MQPEIFCPKCNAYTGPQAECHCGWRRDPELKPPGHPVRSVPTEKTIASLSLVYTTRELLLAGVGERSEPDGGVIAFDPANGEELWRYPTGSGPKCALVEGGVIRAGGRLLFGDEAGNLHVIGFDGTPADSGPIAVGGAVRTAPVFTRNEAVVYVLADSGEIVEVDIKRGSVARRWALPQDAGTPSTPLLWADEAFLAGTDSQWEGGHLYLFRSDGNLSGRVAYEAGVRSLVRHEDMLLVVTQDGTLHARELRKSESLWTFRTSRDRKHNKIPGTPWVDTERGLVYVGSHDHFVYAIDIKDGGVRWQFDTQHGLVTAPLYMNGLVCVGDNRGEIWGLDADSGECIWHIKVPLEDKKPSVRLTHPILWGRTFFVGYDKALYALPWHMGAWSEMGAHAQKSERWTDAAVWASLDGKHIEAAGHFVKAEAYDQAVAIAEHRCRAGKHKEAIRIADLLAKGNAFQQAASIYEKCPGNRRKAATMWANAAEHAVDYAGGLWEQAARVWREYGDLEQSRQCLRKAALARGGPYLEVEPASQTALKVGTVSNVELLVKNIGKAPAFNLNIYLEGKDWKRPPKEHRPELSPGDKPLRILFEGLEPMKAGALLLTMRVDFDDLHGNQNSFVGETLVEVAGPDQPATYIKWFNEGATNIEGDVGMFKSSVESTGGTPGSSTGGGPNVRIGGDVGKADISAGSVDIEGDAGQVRVSDGPSTGSK